MPHLPLPSRRDALSLMASLLMARTAAAAPIPTPPVPPARPPVASPPAGSPPAATGLPEGAGLIIAGPPQGRLDRWADLLVPALGRAMPSAFARPAMPPLMRSAVGGVDGVTGANQFEARISPDGGTALLLPGSAAMAWLVGDPRAQFDAARWASGRPGRRCPTSSARGCRCWRADRVVRELDEDDVRVRPGRSSRPRTRTRPGHEDASAGRVVTVDRGRYRVRTDDDVLITCVRARELGRRAVVTGDRVALVGELGGGPDALGRIVRVEPRTSLLRRTPDDTDPVERAVVANAEVSLNDRLLGR